MTNFIFLIKGKFSMLCQLIIFPLMYLIGVQSDYFKIIFLSYLIKDLLFFYQLNNMIIYHHIICIWAMIQIFNPNSYLPVIILEIGSGFYNMHLLFVDSKVVFMVYFLAITLSNIYSLYELINLDIMMYYKIPLLGLIFGRQQVSFLTLKKYI